MIKCLRFLFYLTTICQYWQIILANMLHIYFWKFKCFFNVSFYIGWLSFNPYPAWTESDLVFGTNIEPGRPACLYSLTRLYSVESSHLVISKMKMDNAKNGRWIIPFKKFSRLRVKSHWLYKGHMATFPVFTGGGILPVPFHTSGHLSGTTGVL